MKTILAKKSYHYSLNGLWTTEMVEGNEYSATDEAARELVKMGVAIDLTPPPPRIKHLPGPPHTKEIQGPNQVK